MFLCSPSAQYAQLQHLSAHVLALDTALGPQGFPVCELTYSLLPVRSVPPPGTGLLLTACYLSGCVIGYLVDRNRFVGHLFLESDSYRIPAVQEGGGRSFNPRASLERILKRSFVSEPAIRLQLFVPVIQGRRSQR